MIKGTTCFKLKKKEYSNQKMNMDYNMMKINLFFLYLILFIDCL